MKEKKDLICIEGEIEDIIYQNDETGYTVFAIEWEREPVTVVGTLPRVMVGEAIRAMGEWVNHPTYGKQFKVSYFEKNMPVDANAMLRYLSSRAIHGIGPKLAEKIVNRFGEDSFEVIENNPDLLSDIPGISVKKARAMSSAFREQFGVRNIMMFFNEYFGMTTSIRIYKRFGNQAIEIVKANPYVLCEQIHGIGFERADEMAARLGMEKDSEERVRAGLIYVLKFNASSNGHCYLPEKKLVSATAQLLDVSEERVATVLGIMTKKADLIEQRSSEHHAVYLPEYFHAELTAATKLVELSRIDLFGTIENVDELIQKTQLREKITYDPEQARAIRSAIENPVTVLTGGPGTGKTTIIKAIVNIFGLVGMKVALAAPTGRAAKRMSESTDYEAKTIHRLLEIEYSPEDVVRFARGENNPLEQDVVIVDELSMVDISLFAALLKALRPGMRLVLIGDSDQLPSVGAGQVLFDTVESGAFCVCRLSRIFRQSGNSDIVENAHRINRGEMPVPSAKDGDFFVMRRYDSGSVLETVLSLCTTRLPNTYGDEGISGVQVITCTRKGPLGTVELNHRLQAALNPPCEAKRQMKHGETLFREQDKVMQIRNNYDVEWVDPDDPDRTGFGVFNGDIGRILEVDAASRALTVDFDGKRVVYPFEELDEIEHAFAVTVHKSQGSEYPIVIFPVFNPPPMLATRNLIYTGITRAKKMAILVGKEASIEAMVKNDRKAERYTGLREMYRIIKERKQ